MTGKPSSSPFLWGDGQKKEHRQWTGPKRKQPKPVEKDDVPEDRGVKGIYIKQDIVKSEEK
jgi:hypothetical protein